MVNYQDFTEEEIEVLEKNGFEQGMKILSEPYFEEDDVQLLNTLFEAKKDTEHCVFCGEKFSDENVFTPSGWKETEISGVCEKCWNKAFDK